MNKLLTFLLCIASVHGATNHKPQLIIFLDIDGVLYREPLWNGFWEERHAKMVEIFGTLDRYWSFHYDVATAYYFDKKAVDLLENFIDRAETHYQVGIVLSSAWREGRTLEEIHQVFSPWRFSHFIIDKTVDGSDYPREELPKSSYGFSSRADQIGYWLRNHTDVSNFIIFDDQDSELSKKFPEHFVHVQSRFLSPIDLIDAEVKLQTTIPGLE